MYRRFFWNDEVDERKIYVNFLYYNCLYENKGTENAEFHSNRPFYTEIRAGNYNSIVQSMQISIRHLLSLQNKLQLHWA